MLRNMIKKSNITDPRLNKINYYEIYYLLIVKVIHKIEG